MSTNQTADALIQRHRQDLGYLKQQLEIAQQNVKDIERAISYVRESLATELEQGLGQRDA